MQTGIGAIIHFAERIDLDIKGIAAEFQVMQRIFQQPFLARNGILLPFALQIYFAPTLGIGIEPASV